MAALNSTEILGVWRALPGNVTTLGWRSIDLFHAGTCRVKAARHAPSNEESILIGFANAKIAPTSQFPIGQGFRMERVSLGEASAGLQWLAIVRQPSGNLELFAAVVSDICQLLQTTGHYPEDVIYQRLLGRVRGWQEFMRKGREGLGSESELGLVGEICLLQHLIKEGLLLFTAADGWKGPLDGLHDFQLGAGAIEVKSTMAIEGFPIRIGSLDQLDDSHRSPLFLAALRFVISESGTSLPNHIAELRNLLEPDAAATRLFEQALHRAEYLDMHEEFYSRRFVQSELRIHLIDSEFPKLTPYNVAPSIRRAQYDIDLTLISAANYQLTDIIKELGVL